jgi:hypothetical protein
MDKPNNKLKKRLLAPLVYSAAIILLFEEWLWEAGKRVMAILARLPLLRALERMIAQLPPYAALFAFMLPAALLLPVKLLALYAIAHGHATFGVLVIIAAKLVGTALVARLYGLTRQALLSLAWFARWHDAFIGFKDRTIAHLRATEAWHKVTALAATISERRRALWRKFRNRYGSGRLGRLIRKFIAQRRARER